VPDETIADDEVLLRRIPSGTPWLEPPDRVTSANFKLPSGHAGLSVYRQRFLTAVQLLRRAAAIPCACVVQATAGEVRSLKNGKGEPLNLDVIAVDDEDDPGHAEIRGHLSPSVAQSLKKLFRRID
jgi:hypothetical protein